jgi:general stress protein YciG
MDPERQREIARKGGASVPSEKRSFSQDRSLAAQAGRKGGEASHGARPGAKPANGDPKTPAAE